MTKQEKIDAIPKGILIGQKIKDFNYMGDTDEIDLIVKSTKKDFYGLGGAIWVYFSITNISNKDQYVKTLIGFTDHKRIKFQEVKRFLKNEKQERDIHNIVANTTKRKLVDYPVYEWKNIIPKDGIKDPRITPKRKGLRNCSHKEQFTDLIKAGETTYFKARIAYPASIQGDEFIIEAFGSEGGYGYLDPNLWTYEETFNAMNDGTLAGQGDPQWGSEGGTCEVQSSGGDDGGSPDKWVMCTATNSYPYVDFGDEIASGTCQISLIKDDASHSDTITAMLYSQATDEQRLWVRFAADKITSPGGDIGAATGDNTWYRIGIQFECGDGGWEGLEPDTFKVNIDDGSWSSAQSFVTAGDGIDKWYIIAQDNAYQSGFDYIAPGEEEEEEEESSAATGFMTTNSKHWGI